MSAQPANGQPEKKPRRRVKKVAGHGGHHGGAWKVAYADLVTAMMALFLVLWLVSQADTKLKESLANYFSSPGVFDHIRGGILKGSTTVDKEQQVDTEQQTLLSVAAALQKTFKKKPEFEAVGDRLSIQVTDEGLRIQLVDKAEEVSFASGSAELKADAQAILVEVARGICKLPNYIFIGGHTDRSVFPAGSLYTNWELSADRANAARRVLEATCVKPEQVRRVVGHADTDLLVPDDPFAPANRRISITVSRNSSDSKTAKLSKLGTKLVEGKEGEAGEKPTTKGKAEPEPVEEDLPISKSKSAKSGAAEAAQESPAGEQEKRLQKSKLSNQGSVSVGQPDSLPTGAKRSKAH